MSKHSPQEAIKKHEPVALLIAGLVVSLGGMAAVFTGQADSTIPGVLMMVWILWFMKWAVEGGIPPGMVR